MKRIVIFLSLVGSLAHAGEFRPVTEGRSVVRFVFTDFGKFFRDNGNSNAILELVRTKDANTAELFLARGKGPPQSNEVTGTRVDGGPARSRVVPDESLAKVKLMPTAADSSVYVIERVECDDKTVVFVEGGTIDFSGSRPGFDLGHENVVEVREKAGATSHFSLDYVEALVPPPNCEDAAL